MRSKNVLNFVVSFAFLLFSGVSGAMPPCVDDPDLARLFHDRGVEGTIVISSLDGATEFVHNRERSETRFTPASTFKIPNTLIALEAGAIEDENEIIAWDGQEKGSPLWNKDQSLSTAFPLTCVWFYQKLAERVGDRRYREYLSLFGYGNEKTGPDVTTFWLDGDLEISVREQIRFLKKVYAETLPCGKDSLDRLKKIMIVQEEPDFTIRAKTGWALRVTPQQGWYVGYVEKGSDVWFFATNLEIVKREDAAFRREISMEALRSKGII